MEKLIKIKDSDNVFIVRIPFEPNETIVVNGQSFQNAAKIGFGHKIAANDFEPGDKIIKFGVPIGSATKPIKTGEHIHLHNMKSDYLPTYTLHNEFKSDT